MSGMTFWYRADGFIVQAIVGDDVASPLDDDPALKRINGDPVVELSKHYVQDGAVLAMPANDCHYCEFDYTTKTWVHNDAMAWASVRSRRDGLLAQSDWIVLRANDQDTEVPLAWLVYRQALRDVTTQADPMNIVWPVAPPT